MIRKTGPQIPEGARADQPTGSPAHVAVIMDGNGRWAVQRGLARVDGHRKGADAVRETIAGAIACEVRYLTLYAFSTENWKRPRNEIEVLMSLMVRHVHSEMEALAEQNVRVTFIGERAQLPSEVSEGMEMLEDRTSSNDGLQVIVGLNYSGRSELAWAFRQLLRDAIEGRIDPSDLDESALGQRLMTAGVPDPDLVIRTGGEHRISNFLLWQIAYSELYFTSILWPDFTRQDFQNAIAAYTCRRRRFGGIDA